MWNTMNDMSGIDVSRTFAPRMSRRSVPAPTVRHPAAQGIALGDQAPRTETNLCPLGLNREDAG